MNYLPLVIFLAIVVVLLLFAGRARRRQAQSQVALLERIDVDTEVMTTSGLHGRVVALNDDDTVQLSIAPGVEVRWELAALRDAEGLPPEMRQRRAGPGLPGSSPFGTTPSRGTVRMNKLDPARDTPEEG